MARTADLGFAALKVEGGLLPPEFLRAVADLQPGDQDNATYGLTKSLNLREEIGRHWRIASDLWADFRARRELTGAELHKASVDGWLAPFFTQVLGFPHLEPIQPVILGERVFPLTHNVASGAVPLVLLPPSLDLDKAHEACGEEGRRRTPFGLVQEYLNASEDAALWGLVSNGLSLRILRKNPSLTRPAWIELDLERLFEDEIYADFAAFWLLAHGSRFEPRDAGRPFSCILERWRAKAHETGERARSDLRKGVAKALVTLGDGFVTHQANETLRRKLRDGDLKPIDLHQQLLRLVYRCLFLLTIEDRDLLHPLGTPDEARRLWRAGYSIAQLRDRALRTHAFDAFGDLWQGLKTSFVALERGAPEVGAPALDGGLFNSTQIPDLFAAELSNAALLGAIKALAFFTPKGAKSLARINYRDMNTEEFGSVYEGLLELHPKVEMAPWAFGYVGLDGETTRGTERKLSGSYYTPDSLVQELIKSALEPVIRRTATDHPYDQKAALLRLKVVDPACGSGHFLLAAARRIASEIARIDAAPDAPSEVQRQHALREVVQHCIYGVDKNPLAVELCKTALWIETVEPGKPLSFLDHRIRGGDSLIGVFDLAVLEHGIPDDAYKPKTGDDKAVARDLKKRNKAERKGQHTLGLSPPQIEVVRIELAKAGHALEAHGEDDPGAVAHKAETFERLQASAGWRHLKEACDLWTAAFFAKLKKPSPGQPEHIPTTDTVRQALAGRTPQALAALLFELDDQHFFHWPLEFPEVFDPSRPEPERGFDVVLGNPPWERIKLQEQEFFAERDAQIASAPNKAARDRLIKTLEEAARQPLPDDPLERAECARKGQLWKGFQAAKHAADAAGVFARGSTRFPLTSVGDINTYAIFAETFLRLINGLGRAGVIVQSGIATDNSTKAFFDEITSQRRLVSFFDMVNLEGIFPGVHRTHPHFCLLTLAGSEIAKEPVLSFYNTNTTDLADQRRRFTLSADDIALINPNTRTCAIFRTGHDAELIKKIYRRVPVLIDERDSEAGNPWDVEIHTRIWHMTEDAAWFRTAHELATDDSDGGGREENKREGGRYVPLYEAKFVHHYDHRWSTYESDRVETRSLTDAEKADPAFRVTPRYWVPLAEVRRRLTAKGIARAWLTGWRDITNATNERTVIGTVIPVGAVGNSLPLWLVGPQLDARLTACFVAMMTSIPLDYVTRQKIGGTHLNYFVGSQLPMLTPSTFTPIALDFIIPRVLELTYTAWDLQPFAQDLGYDGEPYHWDPERRAALRAELDAYYAWLYGLTRDELRYILNPQEVMGEDFPSETFRVLKEREIREHGEYRTRRLVLEAFDRFHQDGTFDPAHVRDPHYFDAITKQLATATTELHLTKTELEETKRTLAALLSKADRDELPTLFVEGEDDAAIVAAAWQVFFPDEPMPFKAVAAGGTTQMRPLAVPGKALRPVIGDRLLLALADNDGEGRELWRDGRLHQGGSWRQQTNGVWWCLLLPSDEFRAVMGRFKIDPAYWPFTIENAFSAALRAEALAESAYAFAKAPQHDLLKEPRISASIYEALADLPEGDPAEFYLRRPTPEAKDAFAAWVIAPKRLTRENYATFEPVFTGLKLVSAQHETERAAADPPRQARLV